MVASRVDNMNKQVYNHFNQVKEAIQGVEAIDYFFAKEMLTALATEKVVEQNNQDSHQESHQKNLYHVFLALSASLRAGHSCLPLSEIAEQHWGKGVPVKNIDKSGDKSEFSHSGFIFTSLTALKTLLSGLNIQAADQQLLVLHNDNLYLRRYFNFESDLGHAINMRLEQQCQYDNEQIQQCLSVLFPDEPALEIDWQKVAVANAINKNFSVIAGGPGTGKTYTVTKLLAALVMLQQASEQGAQALNIALVAPTGKAAQRLSESIVDAITGFKDLIDAKVLAEIPSQAQTVHRLLGVLPNSPNFKHQADNRLAYDIVLIDEVSMVDLPLMTRIFRGLKDSAKVILLGDADQLPSVAAGSVLADIAPRPHGGYSAGNEQYLTQVCQLETEQLNQYFSANKQSEQIPLSSTNSQSTNTHSNTNNSNVDYLSFLVKSRRFDGKGGIGLIANSVIQGDVNRSWQLLKDAHNQEPGQLVLAQGELASWLAPLVKQYYQPIESCSHVSEAFALLAQFRVLCATRQGDYGVERLNEVIKSYLGKHNAPYQQNQQTLYHGQPIMINENDYRLGLYNGDIGILWRIVDQAGKTHLMACFEDSNLEKTALESKTGESTEGAQQAIRQILPSRLPKFESVYAMTIHKTQGSEFSHVALVLSAAESEQLNKQQRGSKLLSRELLYTGITRAKKQLTIAANKGVWQQGVSGQVKRHSGLVLCAKREK